MTAQDLIYNALVEIGAVGQGEALSAADAQLGLYMLKEVLNSADAEPLEFYSENVYNFNFPSSKPTYTWGPTSGNDFVGPVPQKITAANIIIPGTTSPVRVPMYVTTNANEYAAIGAPLVTTSTPEFLYFNRQPENANAELTFWSVPTGVYSFEAWIWQSLQTINALTDSFLFPPGYQEWLRLTTAIKCCRPFRQVATADLRADQFKAKQRIEAFNSEPSIMIPDPGLPNGRSGGNTSTWIWTTGDYQNNR